MEGITLERAIELLTANAKKISDTEEISLIKSVGRVAAQNYFATVRQTIRKPLQTQMSVLYV